MADELEQLDETTVVVDGEEAEGQETETKTTDEVENEIVLAGQESENDESKPEPRDPKSYILKRFSKKNDKLQGENQALKDQLERLAAEGQGAVDPVPDEDSFDTRGEYLTAQAKHQKKMMQSVVGDQLKTQQHGHRIAAQEQQEEKALETYAASAAKLKVSDFNEAQDKACDVLGDDFAQLIVQTLPEDAPKLLYWFGKNPKEAAEFRENYTQNPGSTTFSLGKLAGKLTIKPKRSSAASPESKVTATGVSTGNEDWQAQLNKIDDGAESDNISKVLNARRALKAKARAAGFDVSTLK